MSTATGNVRVITPQPEPRPQAPIVIDQQTVYLVRDLLESSPIIAEHYGHTRDELLARLPDTAALYQAGAKPLYELCWCESTVGDKCDRKAYHDGWHSWEPETMLP